jgi:beta-N-acetylhexosaminidase
MLERIGQLFVTGLDGPRPSKEFLEFYKAENLGGIVLFEENCTPHSLAEDTIRQIHRLSSVTPFVAVDQEGGRVCRFKGAPMEYGAAAKYGSENNMELFEEQFSRTAYLLGSLGVNLLLGPVADLTLNENNECLKDRTFSSSASRVIPFIEKSIDICRKAGLLSCLKHFPGLGAARDDPHIKMSVADFDYQTFLNREGIPFKAGIDNDVDMIMTTHLLLPKLDSKPATVSEVVVNQLLRNKLGFYGIVITDDLLMKGANELGSVEERALEAFLAGHDLLLFGQDFSAVRKTISYFKEAVKDGRLNENRLSDSLDRISGIKSKIALPVI